MGTVFGSKTYVKVNVQPGKLETENGASVLFAVNVRADTGIHVNAQPEPTIESETEGADFSIAEVPRNGDYLDLGKPIKVRCKVKGMQPGVHTVRFVMGFTFCSDTQGWCSMGKDTSSVEIKIKK